MTGDALLKRLRHVPWRRVARIARVFAVGAFLLSVFAAGVVRVAVLTGPGRSAAERSATGLEVGRFGRLEVEGLQGDLFSAFTLRRVAVRDEQGIWLEASDVKVEWSPLALARRDFHARSMSADRIEVLRRPQLSPEIRPQRPLPVSVRVDQLSAPVSLRETFSVVPGRWRVEGGLDLERVGRKSVRLKAVNSDRAGDRASVQLDFGERAPLKLRVAVAEANGGSIAGALGFRADQRFVVSLSADGETDRGRFEASVVSGAAEPLSASGRWSPAGGDLRGRARLDASSLTAPLAARLGPEIRLGAAVRKARKGRHAAAVAVRTETLTATGRGPVDLERRQLLEGFEVTAIAPSLAPFAPGVEGRAAFDGDLTGDLSRLALDGRLAVDALRAQGWRARRVEGTIQAGLRDRSATLRVSLQAADGAGDKWWSNLIGARPAVSLAATRHGDGRWVVDRADATGSALSVTLRGSRGLTGAASFRGRIEATDLGRIRRTTGGGARIDLSGSSPAAGRDWTWRADGGGRDFRTGLAELDRLFGPAPELRARGSAGARGLSIGSLTLSGAAARLDLSGAVSRGLELDLDGRWSARGPFGVGPVEVMGRVEGDGVLQGRLTRPSLTLRAAIETVDAPRLEVRDARLELVLAAQSDGSNGRVRIDGRTAYGPGRASTEFTVVDGALVLSNLDVDGAGAKVGGDVSFRRGTLAKADLTFAVGPGAFLSDGAASGTVRLGGSGPSPTLAVDLIGSDMAFPGSTLRIRAIRLEAAGTTAEAPYAMTADLIAPTPVQLRGEGTISRTDARWTVSFSGGGGVRGARVRTLEPALFSIAAGEWSARTRLMVAGGRLSAVVVQTDRRGSIDLDLNRVDLRALTGDLEGRASGRMRLAGEGSSLEGDGSFELERVYAAGASADPSFNGRLDAELSGGQLRMRFRSNNSGGLEGVADLTAPVEASAAPLLLRINRTRPITGRFDLTGEIKPMWDLVMGADRSLAGRISTRGVIAGTLNEPELRGAASLQQGRFEDYRSGLVLADLDGEATFDRQSVSLTSFSATDGDDGRLSGRGELELSSGARSTLRLTLERFAIVENDRASAKASGALDLTRGPDGAVRVSGDLRVNEAEIAADPVTRRASVVTLDVVEINRPVQETSFKPNGRNRRPTGESVTLDIGLTAPGQVFVRGRGLNAEFALDARVEGTVASPRLTGVARVVRGEWDFAGRRFAFDDDGRVVLSMRPEAIRLDLRAVREDPSLTAIVRVRGTAAEPSISLTSVPALPEDEILSQVLFGRSTAGLSTTDAAQVAAAVAGLAGGGGFDVLGGLREIAGLDRLSFGSDAAGVTFAGGKYFSDDVYLEIVGGGQKGSAVLVEWRARKNVSVISRLTGQGAARLSVRWRREVR